MCIPIYIRRPLGFPDRGTVVLQRQIGTNEKYKMNILGSVGKMLISRDNNVWTARRTLVFAHVMHAEIPL